MKPLFAQLLLSIPPLAALKSANFPSAWLLALLVVAMGFDLLTGLAKAYIKRQARTSAGYRKTVAKFVQYGGAVGVSFILSAVAAMKDMPGVAAVLSFTGDAFVVFIILIEVASICENIYACSPGSRLSCYCIKPLLKLLTLQFKNNPSLAALHDRVPDRSSKAIAPVPAEVLEAIEGQKIAEA